MGPPLIAWSEALAVGHRELDAQHSRLVELMNEIHAAERAKQALHQLAPLLSTLRLAMEDHLRHENAVMREISERAKSSHAKHTAYLKAMSDAVIHEHIAEHAQTLSKLDAILHVHRSGTGPAQSTLAHDLKIWFLEHAIKYDAHLKAVFQAM